MHVPDARSRRGWTPQSGNKSGVNAGTSIFRLPCFPNLVAPCPSVWGLQLSDLGPSWPTDLQPPYISHVSQVGLFLVAVASILLCAL